MSETLNADFGHVLFMMAFGRDVDYYDMDKQLTEPSPELRCQTK